MSDEPIIGRVVNNGREAVAFTFYTGEAGVRRDRALVEFAYFGEESRRSAVGVRGTIGEDQVEVVTLNRSATARGMMLGTARIVTG